MRNRIAFVSSALALACALAGCRSPDPWSEMLEAEKRALEDRVYELEDLYQRKCEELTACRTGKAPSAEGSSSTTPPRRIEAPTPAAPRAEPIVPEKDPPPVPDLSPPAVNLGDPAEMSSQPPGQVAPTSAELPVKLSLPNEKLETRSLDTKIASIAINGRMSGGADLDGRPGHDGLHVLIEPRNRAGQLVPQAGAVSIVVLDPARAGQAARVARWDFSADEVAQRMRTSVYGRGFHLHAAWPESPPSNSPLLMHVRFKTADGRKFYAKREITVEGPAQLSTRWTPASIAGRSALAAGRKAVEANERRSAGLADPWRPERPASQDSSPEGEGSH